MSQSKSLIYQEDDQKNQENFKSIIIEKINQNYLPFIFSNIHVIVYFFLKSIFLIQICWTYMVLDQQQNQNIIKQSIYSALQNISSNVKILISIVLVILKIGIIQIAYNHNSPNISHIWLLVWFNKKLFPLIRYYVEIDLALSFFFTLFNFQIFIFNLCLSILVYLIINILLQNYTQLKDKMHCNYPNFQIIINLCIVVQYTISIVSYYLKDKMLFLLLTFCLSLLFNILYFMIGFKIYFQNVSKNCLHWVCCAYMALSSCFFVNVFQPIPQFLNLNFLFMFLFCLVIIKLTFLKILSNIQQNWIKRNQFSTTTQLFNYIYSTIHKYHSQSIEDQNLIVGVLQNHSNNVCDNLNCFKNSHQIYDSKTRNHLSKTQICKQSKPLLKFFIKCLFERQIQTDRNNIEIILSYCEFIYARFKNYTVLLSHITFLFYNNLGIIKGIKYNRLMKQIKEDSKIFASRLYGGNLDLQNVIQAEITFDRIYLQIINYIKNNIQLWQITDQEQVNVSQLIKTGISMFNTVQDINQKWKKLSKYFDAQNYWKKYFIYFTYFLKNQKIKNKFIDEFHNNMSIQKLQLFEDKRAIQKRIFDKTSLFDQKSCYLQAKIQLNKIIITDINSHLSNEFLYKREEIIGCDIQALILPSFKQIHTSKIFNWLQKGYMNNEDHYGVKDTFCIRKNGEIVTVLKYFKQYMEEGSRLRFVCLLKAYEQSNSIILTNQNFEIQNISFNVGRQLNLTKQNTQKWKNRSIFQLFPDLVNCFLLKHVSKNESQGQQYIDNLHLNQIRRIIFDDQINFNIEQYQENLNSSHKFIFRDLQKTLKSQKFMTLLNQFQDQQQPTNHKFKMTIQELISSSNHIQFIFSFKKLDNQPLKFRKQFFNIDNERQKSQASESFQIQNKATKNGSQFNSNIFIKEQSNTSNQTIKEIYFVKYFFRLFALFMTLSLASAILLMTKNYQNLQIYSLQHLNFMTLYRAPNGLAPYYYKLTMGFQKKTVLISSINRLTNQILQLIDTNQIRQTLFSASLNPTKTYYPYSSTGINNSSEGYNQIDLFYLIISCMSSLKNQPIKPLGQDFITFNKYYYPAFHNMMNITKTNIHYTYHQLLKQTQLVDQYMAIAQAVIVIISLIFIVRAIYIFIIKNQQIYQIILQVDKAEINKNKTYWANLLNQFAKLKEQIQISKDISSTQLIKTISQNRKEELLEDYKIMANLNKKSKKIISGKQIDRENKLLIILTIIYLIVTAAIVIIAQGQLIPLFIKQLYKFEIDGFQIFNPYPYPTSYAFLDKYYSLNYPNIPPIDSKKYRDAIQSSYQLLDLTYTSSQDSSSIFYSKLKNYYFGNPCSYNPQVLKLFSMSIKTCETINNGYLSQGLIRVQKSYQQLLINYLDNKIQLQKSTVEDLTLSMQVMGAYTLDILTSWQAQFSAKISSQSSKTILVQTVCFLITIILHFLVAQLIIVKKMNRRYTQLKIFYEKMMSEKLISSQKIIRSRLVALDFLKK